ncbi:MAG: hypothetical protein CMD47_03675 [Gammaproteobacteria bacterium]|nr:hypothetical protein [Gammaproteobacteria bacterium]
MNINIDYSAKIKSRIYFILIILSFIGPLIFATLMYIYRDSLPIAPPSTNGELLESMINIHKNSTSEKTLKTFSNKKWSLIFVVRGNKCDKTCSEILHLIRQTRISLNQDSSRVMNIVITDQKNDDIEDLIKADYKNINKLIDPKLLDNELLNNGTLYISDPLGNIFMFYNKENLNFKGLRKDLKKVLKISQIG